MYSFRLFRHLQTYRNACTIFLSHQIPQCAYKQISLGKGREVAASWLPAFTWSVSSWATFSHTGKTLVSPLRNTFKSSILMILDFQEQIFPSDSFADFKNSIERFKRCEAFLSKLYFEHKNDTVSDGWAFRYTFFQNSPAWLGSLAFLRQKWYWQKFN